MESKNKLENPTDWESPPADFSFVLLDRTEPAKNAQRFYLVGWLPTLFDEGAVVRLYGRKGTTQRARATPFPSIIEAWPLIRSVIKTRLRHGYQVIMTDACRAENNADPTCHDHLPDRSTARPNTASTD